ncbi:hypothetical protein SH661x_004364 [Planctomicrobium sp. SH661]|uniref:hypothetical protein n=1 Tax=Planctomicrobium sp. SH661 TaxID=3448124 RepID=UPI003F5C072C
MFIGLRLSQAKQLFFDRQKVLSKVSRAERRVLSRFGAYVRQDAKQRIRRRQRPSNRDESPTNQTGLLKRHIYFVFDPDRRSVVIGPAQLSTGTNAPTTLEYGGTTTINLPRRQPVQVRIEARPYMGPAFRQELPKVPALWRDSVR